MHKADAILLVAKAAEQSGVPVQPTCRVPPVAGARGEDGAPAGARVLVKTDGSASTGVTAGQGTLVTTAPREVDAEVATRPPKSHPRVAMWCVRPCRMRGAAVVFACRMRALWHARVSQVLVRLAQTFISRDVVVISRGVVGDSHWAEAS